MKAVLGHTSDTHFEDGSLDESVSLWEEMVRKCVDREVQLLLHAGDFFQRKSSPRERKALAHCLREAASRFDFCGVRGNHDAPLDLDLFNMLDTTFRVSIHDRATARPGSSPVFNAARWPDDDPPGRLSIGVVCLPWFDKAGICATLGAEVSQEETTRDTIEAARRLLVALEAEQQRIRKAGAVPVLLSHVQVQACKVATGQTLIGQTVELDASSLAGVGCEYAALGHIHMAQDWLNGRVAYSGSPRRCNYGEPEAKGFRIATFTESTEPGQFVSVFDTVELGATPMVLLEKDWSARVPNSTDVVRLLEDHRDEIQGADVRLRYRVRVEEAAAIDPELLRAWLLTAGAKSVKLEAIFVAETRVRAPEIVAAAGLWDKIRLYLKAKAIEPDEERLTRLEGMASELQLSAEIQEETR